MLKNSRATTEIVELLKRAGAKGMTPSATTLGPDSADEFRARDEASLSGRISTDKIVN